MKETELTKAIDHAVEVKLKAVEILVKEMVEPLEKVGNPEELIKKPYELWTPQDLAMLKMIYGEGENTPLTNLIFKREYDKVVKLEAEE